jgi:DNA (cytosine-5)-methyltransferase 1
MTTKTKTRVHRPVRVADLFAGWGGFTLGAEQAGAQVVYAANHWDLAVEAHAHNHPHTIHECQDLRQADWTKLPAYDLLIAGPSCPAWSMAGQPGRKKMARVAKRHDDIRADPWAVVSCAEATNPRAIIVENVAQMLKWPLLPRWIGCLEDLGYEVQTHVLRASDFGVPQRRKRLFIIATRKAFQLDVSKQPEQGFGGIIDWNAGKWRPISSAPTANARKCYTAASRHGRAAVQLVSLSTKAKAATGLSVDEPLRTLTTKDQWRAVKGDMYRAFTAREYARGQGFPDTYGWPDDAKRTDVIKGVGNAVPPPLARELVRQVSAAL